MTTIVSFIIASSVLAYLLLVLSFILDDYIIGMLSGMAIFIIGIYIAIYNVGTIDNILTQSFAVISIWLGLMVFINASKEKIEELM